MIKQCVICGNEFKAEFHQTKYCSDECRNKVRAEQNRKNSKKYYQEHVEERREYQKRHYQEHAEERREYCRIYSKKYYQEHVKERREYQKRRYQEHKKKIQMCSEAHNNCFSCDTPDGECRFD